MQHSILTYLALLGLSINISALPAAQNDAKHMDQLCYEDNPLRALERFTSVANGFCPGFLSADGKGHPPKTLGDFQHWEFYSACSCYEKTASGNINPTSTGGILSPTTVAAAPPTTAAVEEDAISSAPASSNKAAKPIPSSATETPPPATSSSAIEAAPASSQPAAISNSPSGTTHPIAAIKPNSKGKRGIAYNYKSQPTWSAFFKSSPYAVWGSNWDDQRTSALDLSFTYIPTIVVDSSLSNSNWLARIPALIASGTTALFGSNEPDNAGQANLPAASAAAVHAKYLQPFAGQVALGTPAVTNGGSPSGLTYLDAFATDCANCTFDFINVHFYLQRSDVDTAQFASALKEHIDVKVPAVQAKHANLKDLPIVIGEVRFTFPLFLLFSP